MYEITFLINEEKDSDSLKELVTNANGKVINEKKWGKRSFSYPIKKADSAFYVTWNIEITEDKMKELKSKMTFNDKLVRFLILKVDKIAEPKQEAPAVV